MSFSIRLAGPGDEGAIAATLAEAFEALRGQYTLAAYAATVPDPSVVARRFRTSRTWVAETSAGVVGTVTATPTGSGVYLQSMGVAPGARGAGVGAALLERAVQHAREEGALRVYLSTTPFLAEAIKLYLRAGFVHRPDEGPHDLFGTPLMTMELRTETWTAGRHLSAPGRAGSPPSPTGEE